MIFSIPIIVARQTAINATSYVLIGPYGIYGTAQRAGTVPRLNFPTFPHVKMTHGVPHAVINRTSTGYFR
jgi:hypothetical protein